MSLVEQLGLVNRRIVKLVRARIAERSDRPFLQLRALRVLSREDLRTQAELAERLSIDAPAVSRMIDRLVDDKLVKRAPGANRRCVCLALTAKGRGELAVLDEAITYAEREVQRHLGASDARGLSTRLRALVDGLDP